MSEEMPKELWACTRGSGTISSVWTDNRCMGEPEHKYIRADIADDLIEALVGVKATIGDKKTLNDLYIGTIIITINAALKKARGEA